MASLENFTASAAGLTLEGSTNWNLWKFQVRVILNGLGLWSVVDGSIKKPTGDEDHTKWLQKDAKAQSAIISRLSERVLRLVTACNSAAEIWMKLESVYELKSSCSLHYIQQKFFAYSYEGQGIGEHISTLQDLANKLSDMGHKVDESTLMTKIMMTLPDDYKHFRSAWDSVEESKQNINNLTSRLLMEEERVKGSESDYTASALAAKTGRKMKCKFCLKLGHLEEKCFKKKSVNSSGQQQHQKVCHYCKKSGHFIRDCRYRIKKESLQDNAFLVSAMYGQEESNLWYMDSGASEHMCKDKNSFTEYSELKEPRKILIGDGSIITATGIGQVKLEASNESEWVKTTLNNVLHVPSIKVNLFSVSSALDHDYLMMSSNNKCQIYNKNGTIAAVAQRKGKMYVMDFRSKCTSSTFFGKEESTLLDWHVKLAHQNFEYVKNMLKKHNIKFEDNQEICISCLKGKQHKEPFTRSKTRTERAGELIHADLCGPMEEKSLGGARYYLLLKDDFSHYRKVYFVKEKTEICEKIKHFITFTKKEINEDIKTLRTDNGTEFLKLKGYLEREGIRHETTVSYTPEQNGKIEREMRTITEAARTMLQAKSLPKSFWAEAVNTAVYTINRTGTSSIPGSTPYELWFKKEFDIRYLKEFGSEVYVHVPKQLRKKWDSKGEHGLFLGYGETTKGYRIYLTSKKIVDTKKDVIFTGRDTKNQEEKLNETPVYGRTKIVTEIEGSIPDDDKPEVEDTTQEEERERSDKSSQNEVTNEMNQQPSEENLISSDTEEDTFADAEPNVVGDSEDTSRRGKRTRRPPIWTKDYVLSSMTVEPTTFTEAMNSTEADKWTEALMNELQGLEENNTWTKTKLPSGKKAISSKFVFKKKVDESGNVKFKCRLVARGFEQETDCNLNDLYAPVARLPTLRCFIAVATKLNLPLYQMDICSAFLNGEIKDEVYMLLPKDFTIDDDDESTVYRLNKSIYGLKKSPKSWNEKFNSVIKKEGFVQSCNDFCLFSKCDKSKQLYLLLYVDDILLFGTDNHEIQKIKDVLSSNFKLKDLGHVSEYLGINIQQNLNDGTTIINQTAYLKSVLEKFGMSSCKPANIPLDVNFNFELLKQDHSESQEIETKCRRLIGSLMYAVLGSRPDLCTSVSLLSRYQHCASTLLYKMLLQVLRYVKATINLSLVFKRDVATECLEGFVDADWGGDPMDRKSTTGYIFKVFGFPVLWGSKKQQSVAISSCESEYLAMSMAITEACWLRKLLLDFQFVLNSCVLYEDNQSAIQVALYPENSRRLKHISIKHHFIKEKIDEGIVKLVYIPTNEQLADLFTKPLGKQLFTKFRDRLLS